LIIVLKKGEGPLMAVIPRPASTVVLMNDLSQVYLTKRPSTMKFFGGYCVFPGGAVDKTDYEIDGHYIKYGNHDENFHPAYYVAAARELFEEAGILLVSSGDGSLFNFETAKLIEYRRLLLNGEMSFLNMLEQEGFHLQLENLTYFGHLITPEVNPIRFDTRFFLTQLPTGQFPNPDSNEIDDAIWFSPEEAICAHQNGDILLAPPTILALKTIMNYQKGGPLIMPDLATAKKWFDKR
jgi:8-oxo-dGTP pyrophosphatase MutT (NUDIX family)